MSTLHFHRLGGPKHCAARSHRHSPLDSPALDDASALYINTQTLSQSPAPPVSSTFAASRRSGPDFHATSTNAPTILQHRDFHCQGEHHCSALPLSLPVVGFHGPYKPSSPRVLRFLSLTNATALQRDDPLAPLPPPSASAPTPATTTATS